MIRILITSFLIGSTSLFANDPIPPAKQEKPILIRGATIHPVSGDPILNGKILIMDGIIGNLGGPDLQINLPLNTVFVEAKGKHVYPGMIAANSVLGLTEISAVRATADMAEPGEINPNARALVSINPDSELIPVTRANGVLASLTIPRTKSSGLIGGQSALIRLDGWTWEDMEVKSPVGLHIFWPELRTYSRWNSMEDKEALEKLKKGYAEKVRKIEAAFADARAYTKAKSDPNSKTENDSRWESMIPVLEGKVRVFIHANTLAQIQAALHFAATEKVEKPVIVGGMDAPKAISELKAQNASVILGAVNSLPIRRYEAYDTPYVAAKKLHEAGIPFCVSNSGSAFDAANERNLPYQAGRAVAHGLTYDVGLKSVTLFPAQILGVDDRLGSLEEGKEATLFISNGDPLEVRSNVERAFVQGREIDLSSRHTQLWKKYSERNRQVLEK